MSTEIVFVGLAAAGKTTLLDRLVTGEFKIHPQTMGFAVDTFNYKDKIRVRAIDLGGQDVFIHTLWKQFVPRADVIVFLIDSAAHDSMQKARDTLLTVISWIKDKNPILMLLANKQDLPLAYRLEECISALNLYELADMPVQALQIFPTSAKTGQGIVKAFDWLASQITETEEIPKAHVHQVYVYESSGVLLSSSIIQPFTPPLEANNSDVDPSLITGFYSALSGFAKEITGKGYDPDFSSIRTLILNNPMPDSPDLKLTHIEDDEHRLACLVVAEETDSPIAIRAVAESALEISKSHLELKPNEVIPEDVLEQHIAPFIYPHSSEHSAISDEHEEEELKVDYDAIYSFDPSFTESRRKSFEPTFFTTLSVLERVRAIEAGQQS
ncbi:MAG: ADP-ribosylation factor-like protein [Candidatus Hodarchaeales archaeon]|jgi:small GTP-binding protein